MIIVVTLIRKCYYWTIAHMTVHRPSFVVYIGACIGRSTLTQILLYVTNFIQTITLGILDQFQQSKWPPKALKKIFQTVPKTSQSNQYSLSY